MALSKKSKIILIIISLLIVVSVSSILIYGLDNIKKLLFEASADQILNDSGLSLLGTLRPLPQEVYVKEGTSYLSSSWSIESGSSGIGDLVEQIQNKIASLKMGSEQASDLSASSHNGKITISLASESTASETAKNELDQIGSEGFILSFEGQNVKLIANDTKGLRYGCLRLIDILDKVASVSSEGVKEIPNYKMIDYPDNSVRIVHVKLKNEMYNKKIMRQRVDYTEKQFGNYMVFYPYIKLRGMYDDSRVAAMADTFDYARNKDIEPIPEINFGKSNWLIYECKSCREGTFTGKQKYIFGNDNFAEPRDDKKNILKNSNFEKYNDGKFESWSYRKNKPSATSDSFRGDNSLELTKDQLNDVTGDYSIEQSAEVESGRIYEFGFWVKSNDPDDKKSGVFIIYNNDKNESVWAMIPLTNTYTAGKWQKRKAYIEPTKETKNLQIKIVYSRDREEPLLIDDAYLKLIDVSLQNVLVTDATEPRLETISGESLQRGVDYQIYKVGKNSNLSSISTSANPISKIAVKRLAGGKISEGDEVNIAYDMYGGVNFGAKSRVAYSIFEPMTKSIITEKLQRIVNVLKPKYIHIGEDETGVMNRDSRSLSKNLDNSQIFLENIKVPYDIIKSLDSRISAIVWSDMLDPNKNGGKEGRFGETYVERWGSKPGHTWEAIKSIPDDILVHIWGSKDEMIESQKHFSDYNLNYILSYGHSGFNNIYPKLIKEDELSNAELHKGNQVATYNGFENAYPKIDDVLGFSWNEDRSITVVDER